MRWLLSFWVGLFLLSTLSFLVVAPASADSQNYKTSSKVTYTFLPDGTSHTVMNIGLTNETSKYYATSYKLLLGFDDVTNIQSSDSQGAITPILRKMDQGYQVELDFNDKVVGMGNTLHFTLSFDTKSLAAKHGDLWEINIPSTAKQDTFSDLTVQVKPPASFGTPSIVRPHTENNSLTFTKNELGSSGISIIFGQKQQYAFHLTYHLKNNNVFPVSTEIALPPTTNYQDSYITDITPRPSNVLLDKDGNWLAQYHLSPSEKIDIQVKGVAALMLSPRPVTLSSDEKILYTKEKPYWQFSEDIKKTAATLKTPQAIYDYVVKTLKYDYQRRTSTNSTRIGAENILKNPSEAVCLEFTDLFIALSRAAGIPAREVDGFAYTDNQAERPLSLIPDVLHAWPEYYDSAKNTWVMVDPTWGNTTGGMDYFSSLDLSHVAFVVKGNDSTYPVPAGGYKLSEKDAQKDVSLTFTTDPVPQEQSLTFSDQFAEKALSGFPISGTVTVGNAGSGLLPEQEIAVQSNTLTPHEQTLVVQPIPPFGQRVLDLTFQKTPFLTKATHTFTMSIADKKIEKTITVTPFLITKWHIYLGGILALLTIGLLIIAYQTRRLPFLRRK